MERFSISMLETLMTPAGIYSPLAIDTISEFYPFLLKELFHFSHFLCNFLFQQC